MLVLFISAGISSIFYYRSSNTSGVDQEIRPRFLLYITEQQTLTKTKIMKRNLFVLAIAASVLTIASVYAKKPLKTPPTKKTITFISEPAGAKVYLDGKLICPSTPGTATITLEGSITPPKKKADLPNTIRRAEEDNALHFLFDLEGHMSAEEKYKPTINTTKAIKTFYLFDWPSTVAHTFVPNYKDKDTTIPEGEAGRSVSRDNPGATSLERTIIRWYFESEPQGARIFWRVISSVPDQVKNTNELWLGTTPFEETRSFNIQGLTYENSRDVQIEIKLRRNGYMDQTKRFNVRQAIDQQEISSFFDMVRAGD